ncbi:Protein C32D5.6 [Aphelenchoides avenae]|nr:Protein C32D5.6 [Aphelenchus avenae]
MPPNSIERSRSAPPNGDIRGAEKHELQDNDSMEFEDALEEETYNTSLQLLDTIAETNITLNLFLNNKFQEAEDRMAGLANQSMYHALGHGAILFIRAMMTCDRRDMERAMEAARSGAAVIDRFRARYSLSETLYRFGGVQKSLTDEEIHAELCYAESLMFRAILSFFYDENLASFIRGAFKIRACYQSFKECMRILSASCWDARDQRVKEQFEAGTRMGVGIFNLMLSALPSKVLRLLEVVGFSGNRSVGMTELMLAAEMQHTLRGPLVSLSLLAWNLVVTYLVGVGQPDLDLCRRLLRPLIQNYPNGAVVLFLRARLYLVSGDIDNAIYFYNRSVNAQDVYRQFHHVCYWELLFAYCYLRRWDRAANHAKRLLDESKWSRCTYTYMLAILINADKKAPKREDTVRLLLERVPNIRLRIAGKSIPVEKFCERKAQRYVRTGSLRFAHYEFVYFWNGFSILGSSPNFVAEILDDIEQSWKDDPTDDVNDQCLYFLLKGVCYRVLKEPYKAEDCFARIIENERNLTEHNYLVPNACLEMALVRADLERPLEVEQFLTKARSYRGYSLETKLHFRIHSLMESVAGARTPVV